MRCVVGIGTGKLRETMMVVRYQRKCNVWSGKTNGKKKWSSTEGREMLPRLVEIQILGEAPPPNRSTHKTEEKTHLDVLVEGFEPHPEEGGRNFRTHCP